MVSASVRTLRWSLLAFLLAGCASYEWYKERDVISPKSITIVTTLASEFCSAFLDQQAAACAVWLNKVERCIIVVPPNSPSLLAHEEKHCAGYNHD